MGTNIELSLSKFDAIWSTSLTWNTTDRPIATAQDVGRAINPLGVEGQIAGGAVMGLGLALTEELRLTPEGALMLP